MCLINARTQETADNLLPGWGPCGSTAATSAESKTMLKTRDEIDEWRECIREAYEQSILIAMARN
jgi:hypothetical protein